MSQSHRLFKQILIITAVAFVLIRCSLSDYTAVNGKDKQIRARSIASASPIKIIEIQEPLLHSFDQISILEADKTVPCEFVDLPPVIAGGLNFKCGGTGSTQKADDRSTLAFLPAAKGTLWVNNSASPKELWINGQLHFCRHSRENSLKCSKKP